jgi:hypothetical protein
MTSEVTPQPTMKAVFPAQYRVAFQFMLHRYYKYVLIGYVTFLKIFA